MTDPAAIGFRVIVLLSALTAVSQFYRASLSAIAPELSRDLALSPEALGMANGAFFLSLGVVQLPVGMLFDRYGPRRIIGALTGLVVAGSLLHAAATTPAALIAARALIGLGCAGSFMGAVVLCHRWFGGVRFTTALSWIFALSNLGTLAAATPLAVVTTAVGWRRAFVGAAALTVLVGVAFHALVRDAPPGTAPVVARERLGEILRGLAAVWRSPGLPRVLAIHTFAYASMITILGLWAGPYLHDVHGLTPLARGNVLLAMGLAQIAGILAYGPLDRVFNTRKRVVMAGAAGSIALLAALAMAPRPPVWLAVLLLVAFCLVTAYGIVIVAHGRSLFPEALAGRGVTTVNLAQVAGSAGLPILTGALVGAFPAVGGVAPAAAYRAVWIFIAVALAAGLAVYAGARDAPPREEMRWAR
ncbi:MAG TPA: MFS transporter [Methylomirabilota bacterium]|nr:MFS transporter [Methylomirabilota bacterium]